MKQTVIAENIPAAIGPYSAAVVADTCVYVSGQLPVDPINGQIVGDTIAEQTRQALTNLKACLDAAGSSLDNVVKTTVFLTDLNHFAEVNRVYGEFFTASYPARSCIQVAALPKNAPVEIEAIALR